MDTKSSLEAIYAYLRLNDRISTSGQPRASQFKLIAEAGFSHVINLLPSGHEHALKDEAELLQSMGISYWYRPVDFQAPTQSDFDAFKNQMALWKDERIWVHCAANMRVSAFIYRWRIEQGDMTEEDALADVHKIWEPTGVWAEFIGKSD